jgi:hypothetical protein
MLETPRDVDDNSREGYGAYKVAAEHVVLDSAMAVSVPDDQETHVSTAPSPESRWTAHPHPRLKSAS